MLTLSPTSVPASPPSTLLTKKVKTIRRSVLMPSRRAVTGSSATARRALPTRVPWIRYVSAISTATDTAKMMTCTERTGIGASSVPKFTAGGTLPNGRAGNE